MNMKTFEMREKRLAEILGAKVLWEFYQCCNRGN
ncbi:Uncharacterized protein BC10311_06247 [Bacillus wiedmannii]|uniref:Uncharacterized protein n=1 Tax=Bacillus wiedmannii TaxID=1890302 RepID=A0AB37Z1P1_9BACI|nr:Uncharacterized protein BC10311_06247 [Bacillus wiedmannii]